MSVGSGQVVAGQVSQALDRSAKPISSKVVSGCLRLVDIAIVLAASGIAFAVWLAGEPDINTSVYALVTMLGAAIAANALHLWGAYATETFWRLREALRLITIGWIATMFALIFISFVTKTTADFSRGWALMWFGGTFAGLVAARAILTMKSRKWKREGRLYRNAAVVGVGATGQQLLSRLVNFPETGLRVLGAFDDRTNRSPDYCWRIPVLGNIDELIAFSRRHPVDLVIVALPWSAQDRLREIIERLQAIPADVRLCSEGIGFEMNKVGVSYFAGVPMLNVVDRPLSDWRQIIKELEDRILAAMILAIIGPLMLLIAALIKIDSPGPVIFRQKRYGYNDQLIEVYKFRTMRADCTDAHAEQLTTRDDPRVTKLGAFLRKTSLDELPQFINVLKGDMSIVGPRPHACRAKAAGILYQDAVRQYSARHRVKPGITGWAQINGWRGETETIEQIRKRVEHDLTYIENWSLWLDLKIIAKTALTGFIHRNAF